MKKLLTIGISTVDSNYQKTLKRVNDLTDSVPDFVHFLIVNQNTNKNLEQKVSNKISVVHSTDKGLSKSRNLLLNNSRFKWLWIQDDDIDIDFEGLSKLLPSLERDDIDIILGQVGSLEDKSRKYKNYSFHKNHRVLNALKVSSIEIIVNISFVKRNSITFNEKLGLGADLPCCEENLFIWHCFERTKRVLYKSMTMCYHTTLVEKRSINMEKNIVAKGYLLSKLPFYYALPLFIRWTFKFAGSNTLYHAAKKLFKGYLLGVCK